MRQYLLSLGSAATLLLLLGQATFAQEDAKADKKGDKVKQYDEIIIRKKSDKDGKVTIEIKNGEVTVNGKKLEEFEDANLSVRKNKLQHVTITGASPFRGQGGAWSYGGNGPAGIGSTDTKTAFLGVATGEGKEGAEIEEVTDESAAEKAGLKKGDVITKIDEVKVFSQDDISAEVKKHKPEDKVIITFKREGKEQKATASLGKRSSTLAFNGNSNNFQMPNLEGLQNFDFNFEDRAGAPRIYGFGNAGRPRLGIKAQDTEDGKGVKVLDVDDESVAGKAGIKEGDIITDFDSKTVNSADELANAAKAARDKAVVTVKLKRDGKDQTIEIKTPKKLKTAEL
jgi:serine protease Do